MKNSKVFYLLIVAIATISYLSWKSTKAQSQPSVRLLVQYTTNTDRSSNIQKYCPSTLNNRSSLVVSSDVSAAADMKATIGSIFGIDGNALIQDLTDGRMSKATDKMIGSAQGFGIFIGGFLLGLIFFILVWPFLCCCCCCPSCCPSKCCQKNEDEQYTKCELYWPTITLILGLLLTTGCAIYGFVNASDIQTPTQSLTCSTAVFLDDVLNGNTTNDGKGFFTGMKTLSTQIVNLKNSLSLIDTQLSDLKNTGSGSSYTAKNNVNTVLTQISSIPTGIADQTLNLQYKSPINSGSTSALVSTFNNILGSKTNSNSLIGGLYLAIKTVYTSIDSAKTSAANVGTGISSLSTAMDQIQAASQKIVDNLASADKSLGQNLDITKSLSTNGNMQVQIIYGVVILFCFFAIMGAILTACCEKYGCRYMMYCSCLFLSIIAFISFFVAVILSVVVPILTWSCDFMDKTLASQADFTKNMKPLLGSQTAKLSKCMPFNDGKIVSQFIDSSKLDILNNMTSMFTNFGNFNKVQIKSQISGNLTTFTDTIGKYARGEITDLDQNNIAILQRISNPSNFGSCTGAFPLSGDSWLPSGSNSFITKKVTSTNVGNTVSCDSSLASNTNQTCNGMMDSTVLSNYFTTAADFLSSLATRYGGGCNFNAQMQNVWKNYYSIKIGILNYDGSARTNQQILSPDNTKGILKRSTDVSTHITSMADATSVFRSIDTIDSIYSGILTNLAGINNLINPNYGLLAGMNCKVFGQDFQRVQQVICGSFYKTMYLTRLTLGLGAWGILLGMCCIVCTGVRHFKHSERKSRVQDAFFKNTYEDSAIAMNRT